MPQWLHIIQAWPNVSPLGEMENNANWGNFEFNHEFSSIVIIVWGKQFSHPLSCPDLKKNGIWLWTPTPAFHFEILNLHFNFFEILGKIWWGRGMQVLFYISPTLYSCWDMFLMITFLIGHLFPVRFCSILAFYFITLSCIYRPVFLTTPEFLTNPKLDQNSIIFLIQNVPIFTSCLSYTSTMFATVDKEICTGTLQSPPKLSAKKQIFFKSLSGSMTKLHLIILPFLLI